jgi:hypothetical protein
MKLSVFCGASADGFLARLDDTFDFLQTGEQEPHGFAEFLASVDVTFIATEEIKMLAASGRLEPVQEFMLFCVPAETFRNTRRPARSAGRPTTPVRAGLRARYQADATTQPGRWQKSGCRTRGTARRQKTTLE